MILWGYADPAGCRPHMSAPMTGADSPQNIRSLWQIETKPGEPQNGTARIWFALTILTDKGGVAAAPPRQVARKHSLDAQISRVLLQLGYIPLSEVHRLLARISERMSQIDEPLAREYVIDPFPGGIEQKIHQMCLRRKALFDKLAESELQAEQKRLAAGKGREDH
jgi:hypothetical protein